MAREEGKIEAKVATLRRLLTLKFGAIPDWVDNALISADDQQLDVWLDHILVATTFEELLA